MVIVVLFFVAITAVAKSLPTEKPTVGAKQDSTAVVEGQPKDTAGSDDCTPPDWAVKMGHAETWKLHHNCK